MPRQDNERRATGDDIRGSDLLSCLNCRALMLCPGGMVIAYNATHAVVPRALIDGAVVTNGTALLCKVCDSCLGVGDRDRLTLFREKLWQYAAVLPKPATARPAKARPAVRAQPTAVSHRRAHLPERCRRAAGCPAQAPKG